MRRITLLICSILLVIHVGFSQKPGNEAIKSMVERYKTDERGPYKDIRWFCTDGTVIMPKEKCPAGGVQHARYKDEVVDLGKSNHIFLGQILTGTAYAEFWDKENYQARLKQYQLEKYLRAVDDGWILQKGQYYRGAFQVEDEETWGIDFFNWLLKDKAVLEKHYFLLRQAVKDIPHKGDDNKTMSVRALSKVIAEGYPAFNALRIKIHGQPEGSDIERVIAFQKEHSKRLPADLNKKVAQLIADMTEVYQPVDVALIQPFLSNVPREAPVVGGMNLLVEYLQVEKVPARRLQAVGESLAEIRMEITEVKSARARLALLDIAGILEEIYFTEITNWQPEEIADLTDKICYTGMAAMGTGFIEIWEWDALMPDLNLAGQQALSIESLQLYLARARGLVEWGSGMVYGNYKPVVNTYAGFEPAATGFYDNLIRSSVLLGLGESVGELGLFFTQKSKLTNKVMSLSNQSTLRGLNPGYAMGELVVVNDVQEDFDVDKSKIYVFYNPPADLKPVAGILTVTEGNMVSHVQLLARNLGIPNAVLSGSNFENLKKHHGQTVFYAVSNQGTVLMKATGEMSKQEKALFEVKNRNEERISVPVEKIDLNQKTVLNMREVNASHSGKTCGPKAANLGQLKLMFPDHVVEGLIVPFGIFRDHMDQAMPGQEGSYWAFLQAAFREATRLREAGESDEAIEQYSLKQLEILRNAIKQIALRPDFVKDLETQFQNVLGNALGDVPVFLRSDTNMEDLKDFTGAGLNLTVFNVADKAKIFQGIKDVWASPYTERSFKWRQRYLLNPENVFPSILIIPSVDVEYSGVMITKGIPTDDGRDLTIAFSRGAGGAVDGQAAESYLLHHEGEDRLLSPAREPQYRRLPVTGGSNMLYTTFEEPILKARNRYDIRDLAYKIHMEIPKTSTADNHGPHDVELGFKEDKIWLFQIRPFVENKQAAGSVYLASISRIEEVDKPIKLTEKLEK